MSIDERPARRIRDVVFVCVTAAVALLACVLPVALTEDDAGRTRVEFLVTGLLTYPPERLSERVLLGAAVVLVVAVIAGPVLLIAGVVARRAGRALRAIVLVAGIYIVLWGLYLVVAVVASGFGWLPGAWFVAAAGVLVLVGRATVLPRRVAARGTE